MAETKDPAFIVGPGRSGTTLLLNILRNHEEMFCPQTETGYFTYLDAIRRRFADLDEPTWRKTVAGFIRDTLTEGFDVERYRSRRAGGAEGAEGAELGPHVGVNDYGAAFRDVLDTMTLESGRSRWAEKSPHHVFAVREIFDSIPDARVVEMVRDPRGVIASRKTMREQIWTTDRFAPAERERKELENSADPLWDSLRWKEAVRAGELGMSAHPDRWLRVRYEDLVREPTGTVSRICGFLDLAFDERLLDVPRGITGDIGMGTSKIGIAPDSLERWRAVLSDPELAICQRVCRAEMQRCRYEPVPTTTGAVRVWATTVGRSGMELLSRARRQLKFGGPRMLFDSARHRLRQARYLGSRRP